ncbi:MAG: P-II family nitrogen regulator [Dehalococcoidia bacterium]
MSDIFLIISIVRKGWGPKVLEASCGAGAEGGTVMYGRGVGIHEKRKIMGIPIEPEKEIILSIAYEGRVEAILEGIVQAAELNEPGSGLAFVVPVLKVAGVVHHSDDSCAA